MSISSIDDFSPSLLVSFDLCLCIIIFLSGARAAGSRLDVKVELKGGCEFYWRFSLSFFLCFTCGWLLSVEYYRLTGLFWEMVSFSMVRAGVLKTGWR